MRAIAVSAGDRYPSVAALAAELQELRRAAREIDARVSKADEPTREHAVRDAEHDQLRAAGAARAAAPCARAVGVLALGALLWLLWPAHRTRAARGGPAPRRNGRARRSRQCRQRQPRHSARSSHRARARAGRERGSGCDKRRARACARAARNAARKHAGHEHGRAPAAPRDRGTKRRPELERPQRPKKAGLRPRRKRPSAERFPNEIIDPFDDSSR